ncbi:hypothetical protein F4778DRAFT_716798 [Xylariomycetidae sp. FL2044]|nr:hypothetical protein F4778DRAFT_716798 [Xylariomycetidae sp. FL2044]
MSSTLSIPIPIPPGGATAMSAAASADPEAPLGTNASAGSGNGSGSGSAGLLSPSSPSTQPSSSSYGLLSSSPSNRPRIRTRSIANTTDVDPATIGHTIPRGTTPTGLQKTMEELCRELRDKVDAFLRTDYEGDKVKRATQAQVRIARGVIDDALRRYKPEELSLSYNGGKDCLVLLILILASLPAHFASSQSSFSSLSSSSSSDPSSSENYTTSTTAPNSHEDETNSHPTAPFPPAFQALYIRPPLPFAEVDDFVSTTSAQYHLDLTTAAEPMKPALTTYLAERPSVKAVFVGTRRTDPHGAKLGFFDETDAGWPRFMRVHPVIDWHYREVWGFIRALDIAYCPLYDMGYTSLGGTNDTHPNPALKRGTTAKLGHTGPNGSVVAPAAAFRPAYELMEDEEERLGRDR